ncbi:RodZ domain-containing protein [Pseudoalteromonas sp. SSDWG2]|uniref:RodZ domain-containing protein n=1 Tax=Pseudoalteromonas sp. SSDWG2 TaxID=3139391 RepID=UPI003BA896C3
MSESDEIAPEPKQEDLAPQQIGEVLAAARENKGWTIEQLAQKMNLTVSKLTDLEQGHFENLGAPIFVKGYIRSYCKLVQIDASELLTTLEPQTTKHAQARMQSFSRRTEKEAHDHKLMVFSYIVLAIIIGSSLFWFLQDSEETVTVPTQVETSKALVAPNAVDESSLQTSDLAAEQTSVAVQTGAQGASEGSIEPQQTSAPQNVDLQSEPAQPEQAAQSAQPDANEQEVALSAGEQRVVMRFSGECWAEVQDAKGKRLLYDIKRAGQVVELVGQAPFAVTLGKHDAVEITVNGEAVDISQFPKNRLAKFSLPLTE